MKTFVAKNPFVNCSGQSGIMVIKAEDLDKAISIIKEEFKNKEEFKILAGNSLLFKGEMKGEKKLDKNLIGISLKKKKKQNDKNL